MIASFRLSYLLCRRSGRHQHSTAALVGGGGAIVSRRRFLADGVA
ncbi:hypothetical protein [Microcoleus sp. herbarium12]